MAGTCQECSFSFLPVVSVNSMLLFSVSNIDNTNNLVCIEFEYIGKLIVCNSDMSLP